MISAKEARERVMTNKLRDIAAIKEDIERTIFNFNRSYVLYPADSTFIREEDVKTLRAEGYKVVTPKWYHVTKHYEINWG